MNQRLFGLLLLIVAMFGPFAYLYSPAAAFRAFVVAVMVVAWLAVFVFALFLLCCVAGEES